MTILFTYNDGGRAAAGFRGETSDCVCRAIAIVTGHPYAEVYDLINTLAGLERPGSRRCKGRRSNARNGVKRRTIQRVMTHLGLTWTPIMGIGTGCKVHLKDGEVPRTGRHVLSLSVHVCALVDGVVHDTSDPSRDGTRCVYGYWTYHNEVDMCVP